MNVVIALATVAALAGGSPVEPPQTEAPALSGPKVSGQVAKRTLVERDFSGRIVRLEMDPAEAAVRMLELDDVTRTSVDHVLAERAAILDRIVLDNLATLVEARNAIESGDVDTRDQLLRQLSESAAPLRDRGSLLSELTPLLNESDTGTLRSLVREYWAAVIEERAGDQGRDKSGAMENQTNPESAAPGRSAPGSRIGARRQERQRQRAAMAAEVLAVVGHEIRRSYDRVVTQGVQELDATIKELGLDAAQEAEVRRLFLESFQKNQGKASAAERGALLRDVAKILTPEQRQRLLEIIRARDAGAAPRATPPANSR